MMRSLREFWRLFKQKISGRDIHVCEEKEIGVLTTPNKTQADVQKMNDWEVVKSRLDGDVIKSCDNSNKTASSLQENSDHSFEKTKADDKIKNDSVQRLIKPKSAKVRIQVGIDFGTSSTKVVYSQIGRAISRAITFDHDLINYPRYCLPSTAAIDEEGTLLLGVDAAKFLVDKKWDTGFQRFKVIVAGNYDEDYLDQSSKNKFLEYRRQHNLPESFSPERLTAIYLAYAMNTVRKSIARIPEYNSVELDLAFNICMPIDHVQNNEVKSVFERIFAWAELIEHAWQTAGDDFNPTKVSYKFENTLAESRRVFAVPEAVASMASYLMSLRRNEGLHAVIDFGAGTTDVSICNLTMQDGESMSYWYSARNIPVGTIKIERKLARHLEETNNRTDCTFIDVYRCICNPGNATTSIVRGELQNLKESNEYYRTWGSAYEHLARETRWENVAIFVNGGGARFAAVSEVFSAPWWNKIKSRYRVSHLPVPDDYDENEGGAPYTMMAVAYGLARPIPELGEYVLPSDAPNHTPILTRANRPDHEELYPR